MSDNGSHAKGTIRHGDDETIIGELPLTAGIPFEGPGIFKITVSKTDAGDVVVEIATEPEA